MPNAIKYSLSAQTLALKKGNFYIGTGDVGKGPTSTTDYYNGITPPSGGYTIYLNKASGGPSIYTAANDSQLISLSNTIAGQTFATAAAALAWFATQTDKMVFDMDYPAIVTNGLVLNLDAGFTPSYPTTGTDWYDVSSGGNNGTLTNGPTFSSANGGAIVLDGANDYIVVNRTINLEPTSVTMQCVFYINNMNSGNYPGIISKGYWDSQTSPKDIEGYSMHIRPNSYNLWVDFNNNGNRKILDEGGGEGVNAGITQNSLNFITVTIGPAGANIYNKGVNYYSDNNNYTIAYTGNNGGTVPADLWIGWMQYKGGTLNGNIYNAAIYNRALSAAEVLQNYNALKGRFGL
jgi:hypothetical protein